MGFRTKVYIGLVLFLGILALVPEIPHFSIQHPVKFVLYSALAAVAAHWKVKLPGVEGNISVLFVLLLIGIVELSLAETLVIAAASVFIQLFFGAERRPRPIQVAFNMACLIIAVRLATSTYNLSALLNLNAPIYLRLVITAIVFFLANTLPVAIVISLSENKSLHQTWRVCYFWSFPYYLAGAAIAGLASLTSQAGGWPTVILFIPLLYAMYRSYCLYLDRLKVEMALAEQMRTAAARVTCVLESTSDCILAVDRESQILYLNERARARFSGGSELVGISLRSALPDLAAGAFYEHVEKARIENAAVSCEEFFPKLNAWFDIHFYPSSDGLAIYLREITEQRVLREQLRQSQKMEAVGRLAGGVAHDFNNLLTIILGYGQQLAALLPPADPLQHDAREILKAGERAASLTKQLLAFSRKQVAQPKILCFNTVIQGMAGMFKRLIGEDVQLFIELDPALGTVKADQSQIEQVVMNLVVNSRDAMPEGGRITISTRNLHQSTEHGLLKPDRYVVLTVSDSGQGMDEGTKARLFEPFFTTKEQGKGTGLGLSTVYGIVQQWGGLISVESQLGQGTTFTIHVPCSLDEPSPLAAPAAPKTRVGNKRIALVEDDDGVRNLITAVLSEAGYEIFGSSNGREVLELSRDHLESIDLLISDVVMHEISGPELVARLKVTHPNLNVLYISGYTDHPLFARGVLETTHLLQKPFTPNRLLTAVEAALPRSNNFSRIS